MRDSFRKEKGEKKDRRKRLREETASAECHLRLASLWPASTHVDVDMNRH